MPFTLPDVSLGVRREFERSRCVLIPDVIPQARVEEWRARAQQVAQSFSRTIERVEGSHVLSYRVVTGEVLRQAWPELWDFYAAEDTLEWIAAITGEARVYTSGQIQSALNLNVLDQPGDVYRWHYDAVPYTAILFLTDSDPEVGGILEVLPNHAGADGGAEAEQRDKREVMRMIARAGSMVLMDGSVCYHRVTELRRTHERLTIPMVYPAASDHQRPSGLDQYLYDASSQRQGSR